MFGKIDKKTKLAGRTWLFKIGLPERASFVAGQYVSIKVSDNGMRRAYSIASLPGKKEIDLVIDVSPMGLGSKYFLGLEEGQRVEMLGFLGKFVVGDETLESEELVFVATGVGVVPLKAMIEDLIFNKDYKGKVSLFWGMRFDNELYWIDEFKKIHESSPNFSFETVISKPSAGWGGLTGHVGDFVDELDGNWEKKSVFLCGNPDMISEVKDRLTKKGVPESKVYYERFA